MSITVSNGSAKKTSLKNYLPFGVGISAASIASRALLKENRADTFVNTAKNCAKKYTASNKKDIVTFIGDFLKMPDIAKWIDKIGNKKMFAMLFTAGAVTNAWFLAWISNLFFNKKK